MNVHWLVFIVVLVQIFFVFYRIGRLHDAYIKEGKESILFIERYGRLNGTLGCFVGMIFIWIIFAVESA